MMQKKSMLIDIDGTLADIHKLFAEKLSKEFNTSFSVEDITGWGFTGKAEILWLDTKYCVDLIHQLWTDNWKSVPLVDPLSIHILENLKSEYKIDIVTATAVPEVLKSWGFNKKIPHDNFIVHENKHELDYDIYIEDNPNLYDKLKPSQLLLLHDRPWNRHVGNKTNVIRFNKFDEIVGILGSFNPKNIY